MKGGSIDLTVVSFVINTGVYTTETKGFFYIQNLYLKGKWPKDQEIIKKQKKPIEMSAY